jgi:hypothetical protein
MARKKPAEQAQDAGAVATLPANAPKGADLNAEVDEALDALVVENIDCPMMYELAAAELIDLREMYKRLEEKRFAITRPMDAAKQLVLDLFKPALARIDARVQTLKAGMLGYEQSEKRKAAAKQALLDKIALDQRAALAAEQAKQAEEARLQSERAAQLMSAGGDSTAIAEALDQAEQAQEMASALQQTTMVVSAATAATNVPTVAGVVSADVWKARVTDMAALLRFIADHPEHHEWIDLKMSGLHELAKSQRTAMRIPGVEPYEEQTIAARRRAA